MHSWAINTIDWEELRESIREVIFPKNNQIIDLYREGIIAGEIIEDFDINLIWPDSELRKKWIEIISNNPNFPQCREFASPYLQGKRDEVWLKKYHDLYFSLKEEGYSENYFPIVGVHIGGNCYYRLDGTHRCSSLLDLGYQQIRVLIIELEEIMDSLPSIRERYDEYILTEYPDYQGFLGGLEPQQEGRYRNLLEICSKYVEGKVSADIGCNAGFLSILLAENSCPKVYGIDISEIDIEAAKIHARRKLGDSGKIQFIHGKASEQIEILKECGVVFFIRSIYHLGIGASIALNGLNPGTIVVIECNRGQRKKLKEPDKIVATIGKRLALVENLVPFLENHGFRIVERTENQDDVIIAQKE